MSIEQTLVRAFADLHGSAPDTEIEFAALCARLDSTDRRRAVASRTAVAAVAATVVTGAMYLTSDPAEKARDTAKAPTMSTSSPASSVSGESHSALRQVAFSKRLATTTGSDGVERPVITVDAGWLPAGAVLDSVGAGRDPGDGGDKRWAVRNSRGAGSYDVQIGIVDGHGLPAHQWLCTKSRDLTVQGHPARLFEGDDAAAVNRVVIVVDLGDGRLASTSAFVETSQESTADVTTILRHVANELSFGHRETMPVTAVLTAAPPGATIISAAAGFGDYPGTYYQLDNIAGGAEIGIGDFAEKYPVTTGAPGRDVQGKPSVIIRDQNGREGLYIKGLYGAFTKLYVGAGAPTLADLYLIADGIRAVR